MVKPYHRSVPEILKGVENPEIMMRVAANAALPKKHRLNQRELADELGVTRYLISKVSRDPRMNELKVRFILAQAEDYVPDVLITHAQKGAAGSVTSADFYWKVRKDLRQEVGLDKVEQADPLAGQKEVIAEELTARLEMTRKRVIMRVRPIKNEPNNTTATEKTPNAQKRIEQLNQQLRAATTQGPDTAGNSAGVAQN